MNPWIVRHMKEKSIEAAQARFTWVRDVSLVEGMKVRYPAYRLLGRIPVIRNASNQLVVLEKGEKRRAADHDFIWRPAQKLEETSERLAGWGWDASVPSQPQHILGKARKSHCETEKDMV